MVLLRLFGLLMLLIALVGGVSDSDSISYKVPVPRSMNQAEFHQSIMNYWTAERRANAKPKDEIAVATPRQSETVSRSSNDIPRSTVSIAPPIKNGAIELPRSTGTFSPPPTVGKVFFVVNGQNYLCSASVVTAGNKDTVITAGHCVYDTPTKKWASNFMFVPAYSNGLSPYGNWTARSFATLNGWINNRNFDYDVGIALMNANSRRQHIQDVTGSLAMTSNWPQQATVYAFGYPANLADGKLMSRCVSTSTTVSFVSNFHGITLPCGMTGGASGGPWIQNFNTATLQGYQTSVNSFIISTRSGYMFGPYFNTDIWNFYKIYEKA